MSESNTTATQTRYDAEQHPDGLAQRLNWLRAGVLGANDGIVSVAAIVVGVASASTTTHAIATAGVAALVGGAISMALGEYVSVSSQRDSQKAHLATDRAVDEAEVVSAWRAAGASALAFTLGGILPLAAILLPSAGIRIPVTFAAVIIALALTGAVGARIGGGSKAKATIRVVVGGALALAATYVIGMLLHTGGIA